jgi:hypothetical protein
LHSPRSSLHGTNQVWDGAHAAAGSPGCPAAQQAGAGRRAQTHKALLRGMLAGAIVFAAYAAAVGAMPTSWDSGKGATFDIGALSRKTGWTVHDSRHDHANRSAAYTYEYVFNIGGDVDPLPSPACANTTSGSGFGTGPAPAFQGDCSSTRRARPVSPPRSAPPRPGPPRLAALPLGASPRPLPP